MSFLPKPLSALVEDPVGFDMASCAGSEMALPAKGSRKVAGRAISDPAHDAMIGDGSACERFKKGRFFGQRLFYQEDRKILCKMHDLLGNAPEKKFLDA